MDRRNHSDFYVIYLVSLAVPEFPDVQMEKNDFVLYIEVDSRAECTESLTEEDIVNAVII